MKGTKSKNLNELVETLSEELADSFFQTLQMLSTIISLSERYYEGSHSGFVSEKSALVAEELNLSEEDVTEIKITGLVHDIGKVGFKDKALYKFTSEMTRREFQIYSLHPLIGREILSKHSGYGNIAKIVYQHHERPDGSGFPNHLKGDSILPGAAIIAVVDTYHNLMHKTLRDKNKTTTRQVHFASASNYISTTGELYNSAISYLNKKKGIMFDTKVVDVFIDLIENERKQLRYKTVQRVHVNKVEQDMVFAEDYYTSYGLLIAAKGEVMKAEMQPALVRFADAGELPVKVLMFN